MSTHSFYQQIECFTKFEGFSSTTNYHPAPDDWVIVIARIRNSTELIESGRYRDINTIGVASITALQNILPTQDFPFAFDGDGMSALLPPHVVEEATKELSAVRRWAWEEYDIKTCIAIIPMTKIVENGSDVLVAKYQLEHASLAMFSGGGLELARTLTTVQNTPYEIPMVERSHPDLRRLSCRWKPIPATRDEILSILVQAIPSDTVNESDRYQHFFHELTHILEQISEHNPVNHARMTEHSALDILKSARQITPNNPFSILKHLYYSIITLLPWVSTGEKRQTYYDSIHSHSDHWKFNDTLRMILDCTFEQSQRIEALCNDWRDNGWIIYGIHHSNTALMTCHFDGFECGKHFHFIDGSDGGYTMASKNLKKQQSAINH